MSGRSEILTEHLARQICHTIERMPDANIPINWDSVITHVSKKFNHHFTRQMLSQKTWSGRKLIAEAFSQAKKVQKRLREDASPKYATAPRSVLQKRIVELECTILVLQEELEKVRDEQIQALDAFLISPKPIRDLILDHQKAELHCVDNS